MSDSARLNPANVMRFYIAFALVVGVMAIGVVAYASAKVDHESGQTSDVAKEAIASARSQALYGEQVAILEPYRVNFRFDATVQELSPEQQAVIARELSRSTALDSGVAEPGLLPMPLALTSDDSLRLRTASYELLQLTREQVLAMPGADAERIRTAMVQYEAALAEFQSSPTLLNHRLLSVRLHGFGESLPPVPQSLTDLSGAEENLAGALSLSRTVMIGSLIVLALGLIAATILVGRELGKAYRATDAERAHLTATRETLEERNQQLNGLYGVFSQISDTLSLRYVVEAALPEAIRISKAEMASLRLLKEGQLISIGAMNRDKERVEVPEIDAGLGLVGRVAKRGRTLIIDETNEDLLEEIHVRDGIHSVLIVPLILGARVVGTLFMGSIQKNAFSEATERIIEMMASQIATVIVAADTAETSERRAHQDALTGLPNRLQLAEDLAGDLSTLLADGRGCVIGMSDIDHFKRFNDAHGHAAGDVALKTLAFLLRSAVRDTDRVYRYGGEEFVIIFVDASEDIANALAERIRRVIEGGAKGIGGTSETPLTISIGLAAMPTDGTDLMRLMELADTAMYRAKDGGRNQVVFWDRDTMTSKDAA